MGWGCTEREGCGRASVGASAHGLFGRKSLIEAAAVYATCHVVCCRRRAFLFGEKRVVEARQPLGHCLAVVSHLDLTQHRIAICSARRPTGTRQAGRACAVQGRTPRGAGGARVLIALQALQCTALPHLHQDAPQLRREWRLDLVVLEVHDDHALCQPRRFARHAEEERHGRL